MAEFLFSISTNVIPAQAGNQWTVTFWFPAGAGMTIKLLCFHRRQTVVATLWRAWLRLVFLGPLLS